MFYLTDDTWFPVKSSVKGSAKYYSEYFPDFDFEVFEEVCGLFGLNSKANIKSLSKGMKKQVGLAIAFGASPKYLLQLNMLTRMPIADYTLHNRRVYPISHQLHKARLPVGTALFYYQNTLFRFRLQ